MTWSRIHAHWVSLHCWNALDCNCTMAKTKLKGMYKLTVALHCWMNANECRICIRTLCAHGGCSEGWLEHLSMKAWLWIWLHWSHKISNAISTRSLSSNEFQEFPTISTTQMFNYTAEWKCPYSKYFRNWPGKAKKTVNNIANFPNFPCFHNSKWT